MADYAEEQECKYAEKHKIKETKETKDKDLIKKLQNAEKNINEATLKFDKLKG